jgi:hypothetical protein
LRRDVTDIKDNAVAIQQVDKIKLWIPNPPTLPFEHEIQYTIRWNSESIFTKQILPEETSKFNRAKHGYKISSTSIETGDISNGILCHMNTIDVEKVKKLKFTIFYHVIFKDSGRLVLTFPLKMTRFEEEHRLIEYLNNKTASHGVQFNRNGSK